jgi:hypothetical protein
VGERAAMVKVMHFLRGFAASFAARITPSAWSAQRPAEERGARASPRRSARYVSLHHTEPHRSGARSVEQLLGFLLL